MGKKAPSRKKKRTAEGKTETAPDHLVLAEEPFSESVIESLPGFAGPPSSRNLSPSPPVSSYLTIFVIFDVLLPLRAVLPVRTLLNKSIKNNTYTPLRGPAPPGTDIAIPSWRNRVPTWQERTAVLLIRLEMKARPEKQKELLQTLFAWMGPTREARGCLACRFYRNTESEDHFLLTQEWKRPSDFEHHLRSEDFRILCGAIRLLCRPAETVFSASSDTEQTEALERTLGVLLEKAPAAQVST